MKTNPKVLAFAYSEPSENGFFNNFFRSDELSELQGTAQEVMEIQNVFGKEGNQYFFGSTSTKKHFFKYINQDFDIIHFALHAKSDPKNYLNNQLFLEIKIQKNQIHCLAMK